MPTRSALPTHQEPWIKQKHTHTTREAAHLGHVVAITRITIHTSLLLCFSSSSAFLQGLQPGQQQQQQQTPLTSLHMLTYQQNERFNLDLSCNNLFQDKERRVDHISLQFSQAVSSYKASITTPQAYLKHSFHPCPDLCIVPHHLLTYWHLPLSSFLHLVFHLSLISPTLPIRSGISLPDHPPPADNSLLMPKSTLPPCSCCGDKCWVDRRWFCCQHVSFWFKHSFMATVTDSRTRDLNGHNCWLHVI